jgi:hypothetical protein
MPPTPYTGLQLSAVTVKKRPRSFWKRPKSGNQLRGLRLVAKSRIELKHRGVRRTFNRNLPPTGMFQFSFQNVGTA